MRISKHKDDVLATCMADAPRPLEASAPSAAGRHSSLRHRAVALVALALPACGARSSIDPGGAGGQSAEPGDLAPRCRPEVVSSYRFGDERQQLAYDVAVDSTENVILTGYREGLLDFGADPLTFAEGTLYLAKLDANGHGKWSHPFGPLGSGCGFSDGPVVPTSTAETCGGLVTVDQQENVLLVANFPGPLDFGAGKVGSGAAVSKYDGEGVPLWTRGFSAKTIRMRRPSADPAGNVFVGGDYEGTLSLDGEPLATWSDDHPNAFVTKLDAHGTLLWTKTYSTLPPDLRFAAAAAVLADPGGNVLVVGQIFQPVDFGGGPLTDPHQRGYALKLDGSGNHVWSKIIHHLPVTRAATIDTDGNVLISWDSGSTGLVVAKIRTDGELPWERYFPGAPSLLAYVSADKDRGVLLTGRFSGSIDFGAGPLVAEAPMSFFAVKLDASGALMWSRQVGGAGLVDNLPLASTGSLDPVTLVGGPCGNAWMAGSFAGTMQIGGETLTAAGELQAEDVFLAKLAP